MNLILAGVVLWLLFSFLSAWTEGKWWPGRKELVFFGVELILAITIAYVLYGIPQ